MKKLFACVFSVIGSLTPFAIASAADMPVKAVPAAPLAPAWIATVATEVRYYTWTSSRGSPTNLNTESGSGSQLYTPFAAQLVGRPNENFKIELLARGGYVWARQSTNGVSGEVSTPTDTQLSTKVTYYGINGIQPFAGVMFNLPTGKSALFGSDANARMDSDLVGLGGYGEGFNLGPTFGFNLPVTSNVILTLSGGYTWRGTYDRESSIAPTAPPPYTQALTTVKPGDVATGTASIGTTFGSWKTTLTGAVSYETDTYENSAALFRAGLKYVGSASVVYNWERIGETTLTGGYTHTNRNKVLQPFGASLLTWETMNTNSDVYRAGVQHLFPLGDLWAGPTGSYLHRENNGYDSATLQYVPAKDRWSGGVLARYSASEKLTLNARVEYVYTREDDNPAPGGSKVSALNPPNMSPALSIPVVSSTGWQFFGGMNAKF